MSPISSMFRHPVVLLLGVTAFFPSQSMASAQDDFYHVDPGSNLAVPAPGVLENDCCIDQDGGFEAHLYDPSTGELIAGPMQGEFGTIYLGPDGSLGYENTSGSAGDQEIVRYTNNPFVTTEPYTGVITISIGADSNIETNEDSYTLGAGGTLTIDGESGVLANDLSVDGTALSASLDQPPTEGQLTLNPDGGFTYSHTGQSGGTDTFTYTASDGTTVSAPETVTLTIELPDPPQTVPDSYTVSAGDTLTIESPGVLANDTSHDLTASLVSNVSAGNLIFNSDGSFTYENTDPKAISDSFSYRATDGYSTSNESTVSLNVEPQEEKVVLAHHANKQRGYHRIQKFFGDGIDRTNLFNGNLILSIPLGISYPVSDDLNYQLTLHYNSNIWSIGREGQSLKVETWPFSNAGAGWMLSLGSLIAPAAIEPQSRWRYVSPDGTVHRFFESPHFDADTGTGSAESYYTRDGTYMRLTIKSNGPVLEFKSGAVHEFEAQGKDRVHRVVRIADRESESLSVVYGESEWQVTDSHGRFHSISFNPEGNVDSVALSAIGGNRAVYEFSYESRNLATTGCFGSPTTQSLLTDVAGPTGRNYSFEYLSTYSGCEKESRIASARLPDGGSIEWDYSLTQFPDGSAPHPLLLRRVGISSKTLIDASGDVIGEYRMVLNQSKYQQRVDIVTPRGDRQRYFYTWYVGPGENIWRESDYALPIRRTNSAWQNAAFISMGVLDCDSNGVNCQWMRRNYAEYAQDSGCSAEWGECQEVNRRMVEDNSIYYEDPRPGGGWYWTRTRYGEFDGLGHFRRKVESSNFPGSSTRVTETNFNPGIGSYVPGSGVPFNTPSTDSPWILHDYDWREVSHRGSSFRTEACFDQLSGRRERIRRLVGGARSADDVILETKRLSPDTVIKRWYGGGNQNLSTSSDLCTLTLPGPEYQETFKYSHGVLSQRQPLDGAGNPLAFRRLDVEVDPSTGLIVTDRQVSGLATTYEYDILGRRTAIVPAPGNGQPRTIAYLERTGPGAWEGPRRVETVRDETGKAVIREEDIRDGFGHVVLQRKLNPDGSTAAKQYQYDAMGSLIATSASWTPSGNLTSGLIRYSNIDAFGRPGLISYPDGHTISRSYSGIRVVEEGWTGAVYFTPGQGPTERPFSLVKKFDFTGKTLSQEETEYRVSDLDGPPATKHTAFEYDARGERTSVVVNGELEEMRTHDGLGRVTSKRTPVPGGVPGDNYIVWSYDSYDSLGNPLIRTRTAPQDFDSGEQHVRTLRYEYDAAGRLRIVRDDVFGNVWKRIEYGESNTVGSNGSTNWSLGRVVSEQRENWAETWGPLGGMSPRGLVEDRYEYSGMGGRVSRKSTRVSIAGTEQIRVDSNYKYNSIGQLSEVEYPSNDQIPRYTVRYEFVRSRPKAVVVTDPGGQDREWLSNISYLDNGKIRSRIFENGMQETATADSSGMPRIQAVNVSDIKRWNRFSRQWQLGEWSSGTYQYDGSMDLIGIGDDYAVPDIYQQHVDGFQYPEPFECAERLDPFGRFTSSYNEYCTERHPRVLFDVDGGEVRTEDSTVLDYNFYGLNGELLVNAKRVYNRKFSRYEWFYSYAIYGGDGDGGMVGMEIRHQFREGDPWWNHSVERRYRARGGEVVTDQHGNWLTDPNWLD